MTDAGNINMASGTPDGENSYWLPCAKIDFWVMVDETHTTPCVSSCGELDTDGTVSRLIALVASCET